MKPSPSRRPTPRSSSRALLVTVTLSLAIHLLLGYGLGTRWVGSAIPVAEPEPPSEPLSFELVETPDSAVTEEEATDPRRLSDETTRSQDLAPADRPVNDRPRSTEDGISHDMRSLATAPEPGPPQPQTAVASPPSQQPSRPAPPVPEGERAEAEETEERAEPSPRRPEEEVATAAPRETPKRRERQGSAERPPSPPSAPPPAPEQRRPTALMPRPEVQTGRPTLTEAERDLLARAEEEGEFSYSATRHFFADYFFRLKREIETNWGILLMGRYATVGPSRVIIDFKVYPDGGISKLTVGQAEGDDLFPVVCSLAIRQAAPFAPIPYDSLPQLPERFHDLPLGIRIDFKNR